MFFLLLGAAFGPERQSPEKQLREHRSRYFVSARWTGWIGSGRAV
jgi:hypothetical protein